MGNSLANRVITTSATLDDVIEATAQALMRVGGIQTRDGNVIKVKDGTTGVKMGFVVETVATATITQKSEGVYEINCQISHSPNAMWWVCLIVGAFFLWFLWIINFMYVFVETQPAYQGALDSIELSAIKTEAAVKNVPIAIETIQAQPNVFESNQPSNNVQALSQLKSLLDTGLITQDEFDSKKAEILSRL